jgi:hypothetical protein
LEAAATVNFMRDVVQSINLALAAQEMHENSKQTEIELALKREVGHSLLAHLELQSNFCIGLYYYYCNKIWNFAMSI